MRTSIAVVVCVLSVSLARADEDLRVHSWKCLDKRGIVKHGKVFEIEHVGPVLQVAREGQEPVRVTLLTIEDPEVTLRAHGLRTLMRHRGVTKPAYLEMLTFFPDGRSYFTRTTASHGPLRCIEGTSDWRLVLLPFFRGNHLEDPSKIVLNLYTDGPGVVELGPVTLTQSSGAFDLKDTPHAWWGQRTAGMMGGIIGLYGGILGTLVGILGSRGKARRFVFGLMRFTLALGVALAAVGMTALLRGQPYAVWYPPILAGVLFIVLPLGLFRTLRRRYEALELRRMESLDAC